MRWNDRSDWVWSAEQTDEAIVSPEDFAKAQSQVAARSSRPKSFKTRKVNGTYVLSGRVHSRDLRPPDARQLQS